jgi:hypothetical protein
MDTGDEIEVRNGFSNKTVTVVSVSRGRAVVRWPDVGEFDVDLVTGELFSPPGFAHGIFSVDCMTGRVVGTRASVVFDEMPLLDQLEVGAALRLDNGARAEVVDVVRSEGTIKIFIGAASNKSGVWRTGILRSTFRVSPQVLRQLQERAGLLSAMAS